jgi:hypothetical protein
MDYLVEIKEARTMQTRSRHWVQEADWEKAIVQARTDSEIMEQMEGCEQAVYRVWTTDTDRTKLVKVIVEGGD